MIKKSTLERIIGDDLSEMWNALRPEEKRIVTDNFKYEQYKKNQIIYAEKEVNSPRLLKTYIVFSMER